MDWKKLWTDTRTWILPGESTNADAQECVGVSCEEGGIAVVHLRGLELGSLVVKAFIHKQTRDKALQFKTLADFVVKHKLQTLPCCYVLPLRDYTLALIEAPNVEASEMAQAVRWAIKEFIDYPAVDAYVDAFRLPLVRASDNIKMAYAGVVQARIINELKNQISECGLQLAYVDIQELALRNLALLHPENNKGSLVLRMVKEGGNIIITRKDELFVSRKIELDLNGFVQTNHYQAPALDQDNEVLDKLALDIQRSMDYCSSMFRYCPTSCILNTPSVMDDTSIEAYLEKSLGLPVFHYQLEDHIVFEHKMDLTDQKHCLLALGAAMHNIQVGALDAAN